MELNYCIVLVCTFGMVMTDCQGIEVLETQENVAIDDMVSIPTRFHSEAVVKLEQHNELKNLVFCSFNTIFTPF